MDEMQKLKQMFVEQIKLRGFDDKFIDRKEEKEILTLIINQGVTMESGRQALLQACAYLDYVVETGLEDYIRETFSEAVRTNKGISKKVYEDTYFSVVEKAKGKIPKPEIKKKMKEIVKANSFPLLQGLFHGGDWFSKV
jgi:hypothetical protein